MIHQHIQLIYSTLKLEGLLDAYGSLAIDKGKNVSQPSGSLAIDKGKNVSQPMKNASEYNKKI